MINSRNSKRRRVRDCIFYFMISIWCGGWMGIGVDRIGGLIDGLVKLVIVNLIVFRICKGEVVNGNVIVVFKINREKKEVGWAELMLEVF